MTSTPVKEWLHRHGWVLSHTKPHGYATTHYWRSPHDGYLYTQTHALIDQRGRNKDAAAKALGVGE